MLDTLNTMEKISPSFLDTYKIREKLNSVNFPITVKEIPTIPSDEYRQIRRIDSNTFPGS